MFLTRRFYIVLAAITIVTALGFAFPPLFGVGKFMLLLLAAALLADILMLFHKKGITARRDCADRFSNGDDNTIRIIISNSFALRLSAIIIDEAPVIFQRRNIKYHLPLPAKTTSETSYSLRPVVRGTYHFGRLRIFVRTPLTLVERRYTQAEEKEVKVYPSFLMLNHYELLAMSNNLLEMGIKRIRRVGNNTEFEQIKAYVPGDEYRTINWKASARRHELMVNVYRDERSQRIYSVIDKGRVMQQAFDKMTLLDYSINAALVLSHIAIRKDDKAGLITFAEKVDTMLAPSSRPTQMQSKHRSVKPILAPCVQISTAASASAVCSFSTQTSPVSVRCTGSSRISNSSTTGTAFWSYFSKTPNYKPTSHQINKPPKTTIGTSLPKNSLTNNALSFQHSNNTASLACSPPRRIPA